MPTDATCRFCDKPSDGECCSTHKAELCHGCYRRTHFVEVCGCSLCERDVVRVSAGTSAELEGGQR